MNHEKAIELANRYLEPRLAYSALEATKLAQAVLKLSEENEFIKTKARELTEIRQSTGNPDLTMQIERQVSEAKCAHMAQELTQLREAVIAAKDIFQNKHGYLVRNSSVTSSYLERMSAWLERYGKLVEGG